MALVIVIDDTDEIRKLMSFVLRGDGHKVHEAKDGIVGLALVKLHKPDLVVSDVQMPGMNGFELMQALRQDPNIAATPVILRPRCRIGPTCARAWLPAPTTTSPNPSRRRS